jgi:glucan phosphoethanolaminetransferase (alkaline phosphatase superfamily)
MATGLLHLHNILRWVILILLLVALFQAFTKKDGLKKTSLFLMIAAHTTLLIGLYQWYFSATVGLKGLLERMGSFGAIMKDSFARFWAVEHITGMIIAIILITMARGRAKKGLYSPAAWMLLIALIAILATVPWPFREGVGRPWFPGM